MNPWLPELRSLLVLTLVFLQVLLAFANVNLSSTLSTNDSRAWLSPSGEFAFGFRQLNGTSNFMVAIWYNKIPDKTVVWYAKTNEDKLAEAAAGSQVELASEGLTLSSPQGESIWTAQKQPNAVVSHGAMLETGNFVLVNTESEFVWESFTYPTDTLLPDQSLIEPGGKLTSRFSETSYTNGRFQLYFKDGNVLLSPLAWPSNNRYGSYYNIEASGSASRLVFDASGDIYVETTNGTKVRPQGAEWDTSTTLDPNVYYYRATLDFYGVFTQYSHPRDTSAQQGWTIVRYVPNNICNAIFNEVGSGTCGYNSYCSMKNQRPTCKCPGGFFPVDPSNQFDGCQSNFTFICGADVEARPEELYALPESADINFPLGDYASLAPYSQQECRQSCLHDCMCAVAIFNGDAKTCWKKSLPLINGRVEKNPTQLIFIKRRVSSLC